MAAFVVLLFVVWVGTATDCMVVSRLGRPAAYRSEPFSWPVKQKPEAFPGFSIGCFDYACVFGPPKVSLTASFAFCAYSGAFCEMESAAS